MGPQFWTRFMGSNYSHGPKPTKMEFRQTIWVCGIGMFVLGFIGFVMLWLMDTELPKFFQWLIG